MPHPKMFPVRTALRLAVFALLAPLSSGRAVAAEPQTIEIKAIAGLRFDPPRFQVEPGAKVRLVLENADDMAHNLILTVPDGRQEVVNLTMTMPVTPTSDFLPKSDKVLQHVPVIAPGKSATIEFTTPEKEGVYPYVCTFPGHGFVMFGAMYVGKKAMPPLAKDMNVPELWRTSGIGAKLHAYDPQPPYLYRIFVRDSGPASIAVALPGGQNYCWDAGSCRLRYAWRGGFVEPSPHWNTNGDGFAEIKGRVYYRAGSEFPIRIGAPDKLPQRVKFHGYRLVERYPEFRYEVDGIFVRELIKAPHHGSGLERQFVFEEPKSPVCIVLKGDSGVSFEADAGELKDGVLRLTAEQARKVTISQAENPGVEPLLYISMNDTLASAPNFPKAKMELVPGVKGRAVKFDGKKLTIDTAVQTSDLAAGATFSLWIQPGKTNEKNPVIFSAGPAPDGFAVSLCDGAQSLEVSSGGKSMRAPLPPASPDGWRHVAVVVSGKSAFLYLDGEKTLEGIPAVLPTDAVITIASLGGGRLFAGLLDELRIHDRLLTPAEVRALYEADKTSTSRPQASR